MIRVLLILFTITLLQSCSMLSPNTSSVTIVPNTDNYYTAYNGFLSEGETIVELKSRDHLFSHLSTKPYFISCQEDYGTEIFLVQNENNEALFVLNRVGVTGGRYQLIRKTSKNQNNSANKTKIDYSDGVHVVILCKKMGI